MVAIVELSRDVQNKVNIDIKSAKSYTQKLKRPTISDRSPANNFNFYRFQIVDEQLQVLDEIIMNDPFHIHFEYVDAEGQLGHKTVENDKRVYVIRRSLQKSASHMIVRPAVSVRSDDFVMAKIDRS